MKRILDADSVRSLNITGGNIKRLREAAGLTQQELSAKLETRAIYVCRGSLSRIENGSRMVSDIELQAIAEILNVPIEDFFQNQL